MRRVEGAKSLLPHHFMKKLYYPLAVLILFSAFYWMIPSYLSQSESLQKVEFQTRDIFFKIRHLSSPAPEEVKKILIVSIDEESCQNLGMRWPWPRRIFSDLIDSLNQAGAKVIGLNVSFNGLEGEDNNSSLMLAQAIKRHGNVVIGATFGSENRLLKPSPLIAEAVARFGYLEKLVDSDFSIRRSYLVMPYSLRRISNNLEISSESKDLFESSFPVQLIAADSGASHEYDPHYDQDLGLVTVGNPHRAIYVGPDGSYTINYMAAESDFKVIPAWKIVQRKFSDEEIRDKVILVGQTSSLFGDVHPTPYGMMPGIVIHANEFVSILSDRLLRFVPDKLAFTLSWLAALLILILFLVRRFWLGLLAFIVITFGLFLAAQAAFMRDFVTEPFILMLGPFLAACAGVIVNSFKLLFDNQGLETKVIHDKLTGLYKYEYLRECLEEEWKRCLRSKLPVSIAMTDLDRFKKINDTLGHEVGNEMIRRAATVIKDSARRYDIVSRYGGDEFVVLLWHTTLEEAKVYRDRLRNSYHAMAAQLEPALRDSSISIGVASFDPASNPNYPPDPQRLIEDADKDLFSDKESRRQGGSGR
ncbi:MAG: hypothetical protein AUJ72_01620 [Candidatus Omnitrophica bacterium CG1_02_46_14]|nr:MAG: hypothetical protein AUJ72_01620 [Candidatus Omnitrophica bacterium CG1_02_46_14]